MLLFPQDEGLHLLILVLITQSTLLTFYSKCFHHVPHLMHHLLSLNIYFGLSSLTSFLHPDSSFPYCPSFQLPRYVSPSLYRHSLSQGDPQSQQQQCMSSKSASSAKLKRTTKRKTESLSENIIGPVLKCTHGLPRTVYTNTDEVFLSPYEQLLNYDIFPSASGWDGALGSGGRLRTGAPTSGFWMKGIINGSSAKGRAGAV